MWTISDATSTLATAFTNTGVVLTASVATLVAGLVALLGLGFGIRHLKKYITGRKF